MAVAASGADEVLFVDEHGRFGEGTSSAILAVVAGVIHTAPHDGRILPSVTCRSVLDDARALGIPVSMEPASVSDELDALYIASTTRHLAPVVELDGRPMPGWDPIGEALAARGMPHLW